MPAAARVPARGRGRRAWSVAIEELVARALAADVGLVVFFDEPALVHWRRGQAPLEREAAIDVLSGALAAVDCMTGVHVCGDGDLGLALEAGPQVLGVEVSEDLVRDASRSPASSTATGGSHGARSPPTGPWANRPTRTGATSRRFGASSPRRGAIPCRCAPAG